jgi:hypothetical protein
VVAKIERGELGRGRRQAGNDSSGASRADSTAGDGTAVGVGGQSLRSSQYMLPLPRQGNFSHLYTAGNPVPPPRGVVGGPVNQSNLFSIATHLPDLNYSGGQMLVCNPQHCCKPEEEQ